MTIRTSPSRVIAPLMTLKGVNILPFGFSSDKTKRMVSRATSRKVTAPSAGAGAASILLAMGGPLFVLDDEVQPDEERRPQHEHHVHRLQEARGKLGIGGRPQLGLQAILFTGTPEKDNQTGP